MNDQEQKNIRGSNSVFVKKAQRRTLFNLQGGFRCTAISDGLFVYAPPKISPPATFLFPSAPKELLKQVLRNYDVEPENRTGWMSSYICLVVAFSRSFPFSMFKTICQIKPKKN
jgi:hypothetical protein